MQQYQVRQAPSGPTLTISVPDPLPPAPVPEYNAITGSWAWVDPVTGAAFQYDRPGDAIGGITAFGSGFYADGAGFDTAQLFTAGGAEVIADGTLGRITLETPSGDNDIELWDDVNGGAFVRGAGGGVIQLADSQNTVNMAAGSGPSFRLDGDGGQSFWQLDAGPDSYVFQDAAADYFEVWMVNDAHLTIDGANDRLFSATAAGTSVDIDGVVDALFFGTAA
jgi:hypothetical protein